MNGEISASVSAVSSQRVGSVTCTPIVSVPLGCAAAGGAERSISAATSAQAAIVTRATCRFICPPGISVGAARVRSPRNGAERRYTIGQRDRGNVMPVRAWSRSPISCTRS
jgi:hypothetical protein